MAGLAVNATVQSAGTRGLNLSVRRMLRRLLVAFMLVLVTDLVFWFLVDFQKFCPPSEGPLLERAFFASLTATGPFAMVINGHFVNLWSGLAIECGLVFGLVGTGIIWRRYLIARLVSYFGVVLWFFSGFCVAGLRIT